MKLNLSGIWIMAIICYGQAIYAFSIKKPINFWAGHKISSKKLRNIKAYNICNGIMWLFLGGYFSVGAYYEYTNNIDMLYIMYRIIKVKIRLPKLLQISGYTLH